MALRVLDLAFERFGSPLYVFHHIVHNDSVVREYSARGVRFTNDLTDVPIGSTVLFSAHGVAPGIRALAMSRKLHVVDATCPLVNKVHAEVRRFIQKGYVVVLVGHGGHDEVVGLLGEADGQIHLVENSDDVAALKVPAGAKIAFVTQTTLSIADTEEVVAALRERFENIQGPSSADICFATRNRQNAVRALAPGAQFGIVVGSRQSSNSVRLVETIERTGIPARLVNGAEEILDGWFEPSWTVLVTSGASTPEARVREVIDRLLSQFGGEVIETDPIQSETIQFHLPVGIR